MNMSKITTIPDWMANLESEEVEFIKKFILFSGSFKEIAKHYGVTYPTVRVRVDKLIRKIKTNEEYSDDSYIGLIKRLAISEDISLEAAKILITEYKNDCRVRA